MKVSDFAFKNNFANHTNQAIGIKLSNVIEFRDSVFSGIDETVLRFYESNITEAVNLTFSSSTQGLSLSESNFVIRDSIFKSLGHSNSSLMGAAIQS